MQIRFQLKIRTKLLLVLIAGVILIGVITPWQSNQSNQSNRTHSYPRCLSEKFVGSSNQYIGVTPEVAESYVSGKKLTVSFDGTPLIKFQLADFITSSSQMELELLHKQLALNEQPTMGLVKEGIAQYVLELLIWDYAKANGQVVSSAVARSAAQFAYQTYLCAIKSDPTITVNPFGPDTNVKTGYLSNAAIANRQRNLTVDKVIRTLPISPNDSNVLREEGVNISNVQSLPAAHATWMKSQLAGHKLVVRGIPGLTLTNLPSYLPPTLFSG